MSDLDKLLIVGSLLVFGWLFFTRFSNNIVSRLSNKAGDTDREYDLDLFNDAIANEVMRLRSELISIKIKQDNFGWDKISRDFLEIFWMYRAYPSCFLCTYLNAPEEHPNPKEYQGMLIIVFDNDINIDDFWEIKFNAESLIKLNSRMNKSNQVKSGMDLSVFLCESKEDYSSTHSRSAKVLSIKEDDWRESILVTLEIDLDTVLDNMEWRPEEQIGKNKIIRQFSLYSLYTRGASKYFITDKEAAKNESEFN